MYVGRAHWPEMCFQLDWYLVLIWVAEFDKMMLLTIVFWHGSMYLFFFFYAFGAFHNNKASHRIANQFIIRDCYTNILQGLEYDPTVKYMYETQGRCIREIGCPLQK
jgi:hypothetical protein